MKLPVHAFWDIYPETLLKLLKESEIQYDWEEDVNLSIWSKYMFIAAYGLVTAAYNKTVREVLEDKEKGAITREIMQEIDAIARKLNIALPEDIVETSFIKANQFPYEAKTSFQRDVEAKGKINEGDLFGGTLIRYGEKYDIPTPQTKMVCDKLMNDITKNFEQ